MAKFKNVAIFVLAALMLLSICVMAAGCSDDKKQTEDEPTGTFYSLQEAYNAKLLTTEDLQTIADYYNNDITYPGSLSEKTKQEIKTAHLNKITEDYPEATIDNVGVTYYGTYNTCVIVEINLSCVIGDPLYYHEYVIGDVFFYNFTPALQVWYKPSPFCSLENAYDLGLLTQADLMSIAYYYFGSTVYNEEIMGEGYVPAPKNPEILSEKTQLLIREAWAKRYNELYNKSDSDKTENDFFILKYCGTYNGCVAVQLELKGVAYPAVYNPLTFEIGGVKFIYNFPGPHPIYVWKI